MSDKPATMTANLTELQIAYNAGIEAAKAAIRATGSDKWEGSEFKPYFINEIARTCDPRRYVAGGQND